MVPPAWRDDPDLIRDWAARSLDHAEELPAQAAEEEASEEGVAGALPGLGRWVSLSRR